MSKKNKIITLLVIILLGVICTLKTLGYCNDTFYLIKLGGDILKKGIDLKDHYSWITGLSYTYPHWLYSIYIYIVYNLFGFLGIYINNIVNLIVIALLLYYINQKMNKNNSVSLLISLISITVLFPFVVARAQSVSIILLLMEVYFINRLMDSGDKKYIIFLAIISLLIANLHATIWMMIFILFLPFLTEEMVYKLLSRKNKTNSLEYNKIIIEKQNNIKLVLIAFFICFFMGIFSPSRICYTYIFKTMLGDSQSFIAEHAQLIAINEPIFLLSLCLLFFINTKIKLRELLMIGGITLMSFLSLRHLIFFYTVGLLYISIIICRYLKEHNERTLDILVDTFYSKKIIYITVIALLMIGVGIKLNANKNIAYVDKQAYPVEAVKYIKKELDYKNIKLFNEYGIGSYLLFNDIPVMIDSRCDLYFKEFNGIADIFDDVMDIEYKYNSIFKKYNINYILISKENILTKLLQLDSNYKLIYHDKNFVIYSRGISNEKI